MPNSAITERFKASFRKHYRLKGAVTLSPLVYPAVAKEAATDEPRFYRVDADNEQFLLKRYKTGKTPWRIDFEERFQLALWDQDPTLVPELIPTNDQEMHFLFDEQVWRLERYVACLHYRWWQPQWSAAQCKAAGRFLARFHAACQTVSPSLTHNLSDNDKSALQISPLQMSDVRKIVWLALHNGAALKEPDLQEVLAKSQSLADSSLVADLLADQSPKLLVHGDFHMGNLLVCGENIQGVVDYEDVRLQSQSYDLGYAALMLCSAPTGESPAPLDAKYLQHFSDGYFSNTRHTPSESDIIVACALVSSWLLERAPSWEDKPSALSYLQRTIATWSYYARSITGAQ